MASVRRLGDAEQPRHAWGRFDVVYTASIFPKGHPRYPFRLAEAGGPDAITVLSRHNIANPGPVVAIVGTRHPTQEAEAYASELAALFTRAGAIVASGGAMGIDAAAHRGALDANGVTWAVLPTGCDHVYPHEHAPLYERIAESEGAVIWPFPFDQLATYATFYARNRVLVALSDAVIVVQAGIPSGALNAAKHARELNRPLWVVSPPAWDREFAGSLALIDGGAKPLTHPRRALESLGLAPRARKTHTNIQRRGRTPRTQPSLPTASKEDKDRSELDVKWPQDSFLLSTAAQAVFQVAESMPLHIDELISRTGLPAAAVSTALLTLALENVLVEGPNGFFRRAEAYKKRRSLVNSAPLDEKDANEDGEDARSRRIARQGEDDQEVPGGSLRRSRIEGAR